MTSADETDRATVAVLGSDRIGGRLLPFCVALGGEIARRGLDLASGADPTVGIPVAKAYHDVTQDNSRLRFFVREIPRKMLPFGTWINAGADLPAMRRRLLGFVDAAIVVGGGKGTEEECNLAAANNRPLIPVPTTGGTARYAEELVLAGKAKGLVPSLDDLDGTTAAVAKATVDAVCYLIENRRYHSGFFVSYCHADTAFVDDLCSQLDRSGVHFWRDTHDATSGRLEKQIDRAMRVNAAVLLVLSKHSVKSDWVEWEAEKARDLENVLGRDVLCPVALDDSWKTCNWPGPLRQQVMKYNILDFSNWKEPTLMTRQFKRLLDGLALFYGPDGILATLSFDQACTVIQGLAATRRVSLSQVEPAPPSPQGTQSFRARELDGKGVIYCHATGNHQGAAYYVRKGIGWVYECLLGGATSPLGLPISNEELVNGPGNATSFFERGYIDWSATTGIVRVVHRTTEGESVILERRL